MRMLFFAHSGLRYLVLLVALVALAYFAYAVATKKGDEKISRILGSSFVGLVDLQALIGIALVATGVYYSALMGHLFMMIGAAVVGHVAMAMAKKTEPVERRSAFRLAGVVIALALIVGGIMSIGRDVFGSGPPPTIS